MMSDDFADILKHPASAKDDSTDLINQERERVLLSTIEQKVNQ